MILSIKHIDLVNDYHRIEDRLKSALKYIFLFFFFFYHCFEYYLFSGEDIGSYTQDDFLNEIHELHNRLNQRRNLIETHSLQVDKQPFLNETTQVKHARP